LKATSQADAFGVDDDTLFSIMFYAVARLETGVDLYKSAGILIP